jgi:argininosuccinate lyase
VAVRDRFGGPAPTALRAALQDYRTQLGILTDRARAIAGRESEADAALQAKFHALMGEV